jgi:hypothetical protein
MKTNEAQVQMVVTINSEIDRVFLHLKEQRKHVRVAYIANVVESTLDKHRISPDIIRFLSIQELKQRVRARLRRCNDPVELAEQAVDDNQDDMFGSILQDYYPVDREVMGEPEKLYIPIEDLTHEDVDEIIVRMRKIGDKLHQHCDALAAWDAER